MFLSLPSNQYCTNALQASTKITSLEIGKDACQFESVTALDLSKYPKVKTVRISHESFSYVNEVKMIGLKQLESVEIGMNSFTKFKSTSLITSDPNRHFYLKNCSKLKYD